MKNLLILGAGTAGTTLVNKLRPKLDRGEWRITIVDSDPDHCYRPGYLFLPSGGYTPEEVIKPKRDFIPDGVDCVEAVIEFVEPERRVVVLADGAELPYDFLVIATGTHPRMLKKQIADQDVPEVPEFLTMLHDMGAHLWACQMSVDMIGLDKDDLIDEVEDIIDVSEFIEVSDGAQIIFV